MQIIKYKKIKSYMQEFYRKNSDAFYMYYMNFSKVYEIKMILRNIIKTDGAIKQ